MWRIVGNIQNEINDMDNVRSRWSAEINIEVENILCEVGDRDNASNFPALAKHLLHDITMFPLCSNVCRDDFGYGRIQASSASVEREFNKLKNCILKNHHVPMRADEFVKIHLDHLRGKMKITDAENEEIASQNITSTEDCQTEIMHEEVIQNVSTLRKKLVIIKLGL